MPNRTATQIAHLQISIKARAPEVDCGYTSPCWISDRATQPNGYTKMGYLGQTYLTHRLAYEVFTGSIPDGLVIDHLCRQRACCNPTHMEPVTTRINLLRGEGLTAQQVRRTHCPQGHPLSGDNLYLRPDRTGRSCRACRYQANKMVRDGSRSRARP